MNKLKKLREKRKLTQEELANKAGVSRVTISNLENGTYENINLSTLRKLASALHVPVGYFF